MNATNTSKLLASREVPEGADAREFRLAENIYVLYAMTREDRRGYVAKLQAKRVDAVTVAAICKLFNVEAPKAAVSEQVLTEMRADNADPQ